MADEALTRLLTHFCDEESPLLKEIDRETNLKVLMPRMLSGHYQGRVLSMLSKLLAPKRILEIGTFTGYATLCLAEGLAPEGRIVTIDINAELEDRVRNWFKRSGHDSQINYIIGEARALILTIEEHWDMIFIDADKKNNSLYFDLVFDSLRPGGIIIIDNVLWGGKVLANAKDPDTKNIITFNNKIAEDTRVEKLILPVRDGLFIIRKI